MSLFEQGDFTLHSGGKSKYRIDCAWLSNEDIKVVAKRLSEILPPFKSVEGIPQGGLRLATAMSSYMGIDHTDHRWASTHLIVDDVWTTGESMTALRQQREAEYEFVWGAVIFRRGMGDCPAWVFPFADVDI